MKKNYIARRLQRSLLITCLLASTSFLWAQSSQQKTGVGSLLPNKGVTMGPANPLDASTTSTNSTCPTCGTVLNSVTCSGGRSWNGNYCYCPSGTWDGFSCVLPTPPAPACTALIYSSAHGAYICADWVTVKITCISSINGVRSMIERNTNSSLDVPIYGPCTPYPWCSSSTFHCVGRSAVTVTISILGFDIGGGFFVVAAACPSWQSNPLINMILGLLTFRLFILCNPLFVGN